MDKPQILLVPRDCAVPDLSPAQTVQESSSAKEEWKAVILPAKTW
jgi:hypothetical protein